MAAGLTLLATAFPPAILFAWLWAIISPVVVIGLFQHKSPRTPITTSFGARLGLVTGLGIAVVMTVINTVVLLMMRRTHGMDDFDKQWTALLDQMQKRVVEQQGADALPIVHAFTLPEFRAGMVLAGIAIACTILLFITTAGGAFAGFIRSRSKA